MITYTLKEDMTLIIASGSEIQCRAGDKFTIALKSGDFSMLRKEGMSKLLAVSNGRLKKYFDWGIDDENKAH